MATIKEDYCDFETAKLLKEKWFKFIENKDELSKAYVHAYTKEGKEVWGCYSPDYYPCITMNMAMKWLREVHGLHISLEPCYDYDSMHVVFLAFVQNVADVHEFMDGRKNVASYPNAEKSYELAIKYCLENLI